MTTQAYNLKHGKMGQVVIDFSFASNRLSKLSNFSGPIMVQSEAKLMPSRVTFDTQKKVTLKFCVLFKPDLSSSFFFK